MSLTDEDNPAKARIGSIAVAFRKARKIRFTVCPTLDGNVGDPGPGGSDARQVERLACDVVRAEHDLSGFADDDDVGGDGVLHAAEQRILDLFGPVLAQSRAENASWHSVGCRHRNGEINKVRHTALA